MCKTFQWFRFLWGIVCSGKSGHKLGNRPPTTYREKFVLYGICILLYFTDVHTQLNHNAIRI